MCNFTRYALLSFTLTTAAHPTLFLTPTMPTCILLFSSLLTSDGKCLATMSILFVWSRDRQKFSRGFVSGGKLLYFFLSVCERHRGAGKGVMEGGSATMTDGCWGATCHDLNVALCA